MYHGILCEAMQRLEMTRQEMANYLGISLNLLGSMLTMKHIPNFNSGKGKKLKILLESVTEMSVTDIFPSHIFTDEFLKCDKRVEVTREIPANLISNASQIYQLPLSPGEQLLLEDDFRLLDEALRGLEDREAQILRMRFFEEKTLEECGKRLKVSTSWIRQIEAGAIRKLRSSLEIEDDNWLTSSTFKRWLAKRSVLVTNELAQRAQDREYLKEFIVLRKSGSARQARQRL